MIYSSIQINMDCTGEELPMMSYQYTPLNEKDQEIRLMTLHPASFDQLVFISIEITTLTETYIPEFEALSYTWGNASDCQDLLIQAGEPAETTEAPLRRLPITINLFQALQHLRYLDRSRVFWIDAVCVNQKNLDERGRQVQRMPDIYSSAAKVVVWLGPASDDSTLAIQTMDNIGSRIQADWLVGGVTAVAPNHLDPWSDEFYQDINLREQVLLSIRNLLRRSWFERLWIWQEVCLATHEIEILCGFDTLPYESFCNAVNWLHIHINLPIPDWQKLVQQGYRTAEISHRKLIDSFEYIMRFAQDRKCSDPRDKVYAVLSLLNDSERESIVPDYSKSVSEVFQMASLQWSISQRRLRSLVLCAMPNSPQVIPSWANWSESYKLEPLRMSRADAVSEAHTQWLGDGVLMVNGIWATSVGKVEHAVRHIPGDEVNSVEAIGKLAQSVLDLGCLDVAQGKIRSLCRSLNCNEFIDSHIPTNSRLADLERAVEYTASYWRRMSDNSLPLPESCDPFLNLTRVSMNGRSLIVTTDGCPGLAPENTKPGDKICVILGCPSPLILREETPSHYAIVGECYVDGIMNGELLLGQLPSDWKLVYKWFPEYQEIHYAFLDQDTGETQVDDPRLWSLPLGWHTEAHPRQNAWNWYSNDNTDEDPGYVDPRLRPAALRDRGIDIQEIKLI